MQENTVRVQGRDCRGTDLCLADGGLFRAHFVAARSLWVGSDVGTRALQSLLELAWASSASFAMDLRPDKDKDKVLGVSAGSNGTRYALPDS